MKLGLRHTTHAAKTRTRRICGQRGLVARRASGRRGDRL